MQKSAHVVQCLRSVTRCVIEFEVRVTRCMFDRHLTRRGLQWYVLARLSSVRIIFMRPRIHTPSMNALLLSSLFSLSFTDVQRLIQDVTAFDSDRLSVVLHIDSLSQGFYKRAARRRIDGEILPS